MASVYADILDRIEQQGFTAPRRRVSLSKTRLLFNLLRHGVL
jgi:hypothetical protein